MNGRCLVALAVAQALACSSNQSQSPVQDAGGVAQDALVDVAGGDGASATTRRLAVSLVPQASFDGSDGQFNAMVDMVASAGVGGYFALTTWAAIERTQGAYDLTMFQSGVSSLDAIGNKRGMTILLDIAVINTSDRGVPAYLRSTPFDSDTMKKSFHNLIDALVATFNDHVVYLAIGNEIDVYFHIQAMQDGGAPDTWTAYKSFYDDAVAYVHSKAPNVKVGACTTFDDANGVDKQNVQTLNASSDVAIFTYHPLVAGSSTFQVRDASTPTADFPAMLSVAQGKPIVLQEVGYSSAAGNGSSEAQHAQYVANVFSAWQSTAGAIPFLSFYTLHDFTQSQCQQQAQGYGLPGNQPFIDYLCSTGLRRSDGSPKQAWSSFVSGAASMK